jgi:hypothetical protein
MTKILGYLHPPSRANGLPAISVLDERIGDYASNDADWPRVPTLLNVESPGIHGRVCFRESR